MIEHIERRALALLLVVLMVFAMVPVHAFAAGTRTETASMGNLGISVSIPTENGGGADLGSFNLTGNTIVATAKAEANTDSCTGVTSYNATQTIITFTNNASGEAMIRFDFNINGGKLEVNGVEQATSGSYATGAIAAGGTLEVKLYSPESGANKVGDSGSMTLTNLEIIENNTVSVVIKPGTNGTVKVKGAAISADTTVATTYVEGVAVAATPASGYKFIAWVDETNTVVSAAANTTLHLSQNATVRAYFVPTSTNGYWLAGSKIHTDLENAIAAAQAADGMVRLLDSTTLTKSVTIPAGVTVVIPCDTDMIFYGENPVAIARPNGTLAAPTAFRTLTMADGVVLTVYGSLEASARHYVAHGGKFDGGRVIDKYGFIKMNTNSRIDVQSGGKLFAWGYISGSGKVNAYSGATVYEKFQIADYRGGGITSIIVPSGVFPFNQYYVQNVEVPETIHGGATLICNAGIYGSEVIVSNMEFIGPNGMFNVGAGSTATKRYDAASDRLVIDVEGQVGLNSISLMDYNTANFVLPINHNITVNINSGMTTINQDLLLQPGAEVNVDRDAYLALAPSKKVYLMDADNWGNYCFGATMRPIYYTVANGTTVKRSTLSDAKVNLNGTAVVQGQLYASTAGAQVISAGKTGVVVLMNSAPSGTTNIKQSSAVSAGLTGMTTNISMGAALLTNADTTTVNTNGAAQYTTYVYDSVLDKWVTTAISIAPTLTYNANGGNGTDRALTINYQNTALSGQPLSQVVDGAGTFTREGAVFTGWNTAADGSGKAFAPGDFITISQNTTLFAQWRNTSATVSFAANAPEGTTAQGQMNSQTLILDENGNSEFEVPACGYTVDGYTFDGWLGSDGNYYVVGQVYTVSGDLTLTAQWTKSSVVITFNANAPAGTTASGAMADQFAMEGDKLSTNAFAVTGYTFVGWNTKADGSGTAYADAATAPAVNTTLFAQWKINTYTITWIIDGKSETTTVNHGQVPVAPVATKAPDGCTVYTFDSWDKTIVAATTDATYTAVFTESASHTEGTPVTENKVEADCENDGSYDTVVYCSVCGEELSRVTSTIPALGHSEPVYTNNGDTHSVDYPCCDGLDVVSESHTYENGQCICGAKEPFTVGVANSYGVADTITLSNPIAIPGQDYVTTISGTVGTSFGIWGVYNAEGEWIDPYFCCEFDGETNTLTVRGEYVDEGMVLNIGAWVTATYYLNGGYVNDRYDTSFVPDANGAFTWEWNCGDYPFSFWSYDFGTTHDGNFAFEREGYTLVGYNTAADGSGTMYGFEQKVAHTEDIVLYMIWECNHDTWQDATCTAPKTCTTCGKTEGEALGHSEPVYTNNGDTHSAVYPCCGEAYVTNEPHDFENEDHKCVCGMVEIVHYTVEVYYMDTEGNYPETPSKTMNFSAPYGTKVDHYDDVQTPGFVIFETLPKAIVTENLVIKVKMQRAAIQIQYRDEQDNILGRQLIYFEATDTLRTDEEVAPARTGYTFVGWANEIGGDVVYSLDNLEYTNTSTSVVAVEVLYPVYELNTYTVTFTVLGQVYDTVTVTYGEKIALPETDPEVEGYRFNGWKNVPNSMPDNDLTIEADLVEQVTISYYRYNIDTYQYEYDYDVTVDKGAEVKLPYYYWNYSNTLGWDANDDGVVDYDYLETITADESLTLKPVLVPFYADVDLGAEDAVFVDAEGNPITRIYAENAYINEIILTNHPTREGYTFLGWLVDGSENLVYTNEETGKLEVRLFFGDNCSATALWEQDVYTITFEDGKGNVLLSEGYTYGQMPSVPATPNRADEDGYKFVFAGWSPAVVEATEDAVYTATWTKTRITYTVSFDTDGDGTIDAMKTVAHGDVPEAPAFSLADTAEWDYTFTGWRDSDGNTYTTLPAADGADVYTAIYTAVKQTYTITWIIDSASETTTVEYGAMPTHADPSKADTAEYTYTFAGWSPKVVAVTGEATYTAEFTAQKRSYEITWIIDGASETTTVEYGVVPTHADPSKADTAEYTYTFAGWSPEVKAVTGEATYTAEFTAQKRSYEITWIIDGASETTIVEYGVVPTHADPSKAENAQYTYTFAGWSPEVVAVTGEATYTANFTPVLRSYDITFVVDGVEKVVSTKYGETPVYDADGKVPVKESDEYFTYEFAGWTPVLEAVTGEATYTATWTETPVEYTITFMEGNEIIGLITGNYGDAVDMTKVPATDRLGYTFNGWNTMIPDTIPAENLVINGSWTINQYTITFTSIDEQQPMTDWSYTITKNFGEAITEADIAAMKASLPNLTGWQIIAWSDEIPTTMPADNLTIYAQWDPIRYLFNIYADTSMSEDSWVTGALFIYGETYDSFESFNVAFGFDQFVVMEGYELVGYKFEDGTDMTFPYVNPDHDVNLIAQFKPIDYTVTFMDGETKYTEVNAGYGTAITLPENPTKEGYVFAGWVDADGNAVDLSTMPLNGMTVYASWTVDSFMLSFFASEGDTTAYQTFEVTYGTELNDACLELMMSLIPDPVKEGYTWNGWNIDNVPETMPASAVNVYGEWTANTYTIYWSVVENVDDETVGEFSVDFQFGSAITAPEYTAPAGYEVVDVQSYPATMPAEALYLQITIAPKTYTVTFDSCGGTPVDSISAAYESAITAPAAPTKTGHIFMGWSVDGETVIDFPATMPIDGLNLKAVWQKDTVYITFIIEGVETVKAFAYGDAIVAPEATKAADAKWTYKFVGWDAELPAYATETAAYTALFAEDEAVKYNVKFVDGENTVFETQIAWNDVVTLDGFTAPELTGNTLAWTVDGAAASFPYAMTTADVTFVASWTPITYTVYYYTVDGFANGEAVYTAQATYGAAFPTYTLTLPEGYDFGYWADANGNAYDLPETMPAQDLHLIAQLTPKTFTVTWIFNDWIESTYTYGETVEGFIPENYILDTELQLFRVEFVCWLDYYTNEVIKFPFTMPAKDLMFFGYGNNTGWYERPGSPKAKFWNNSNVIKNSWFCVNDNLELVTDGSGTTYYADADGYICYDLTEIDGVLYAFDHENGAFLSDYTGLYEDLDGNLYYVENGIAVKNKGLVKDVLADGHIHYYYFGCGDATCTDEACAGEYKAQRNCGHWAEITNGYLVLWGYQFDENGVIIHDEDTSKNGVHLDNGVKFYYIDGVKVHYGLFIGDDGEYYYAKSDGSLVTSRDYWISASHINGLTYKGEPIVEGSYTFDEEGRIVWPATEKNGVYIEDGKLYYYEAGLRTYAGLIKYTGKLHNEKGDVIGTYNNDIIYVRGSGELAVGKYWPTKTNGLMESNTYQFDKSGKMMMLSGIIAEDGSLYYYVDGLRNYAGLIEIDGSFYYVRGTGEVVNSRSYWITKTNGLMDEGKFDFAADGKMIIPAPVVEKNGVYRENGKLMYYVDGKLNYAGLIQYTGDLIEEDGTVIKGVYQNAYIYVRGTGELVFGRSYWTTKHNDLMKSATYQFDENGIMQNPAV